MFGTGAAIAVALGAAAIIGGSVAAGMVISSENAKEGAIESQRMQAESQKYIADQQRAASEHEADLLFKTEQADRDLSVRFNDQERSEERQMMQMFGMIDDIQVEEGYRVDSRGRQQRMSVDDLEHYYPDPVGVSDDDLSFS